MLKAKSFIQTSGSEEGFDWQLYNLVYEGTKIFSGHFVLTGKLGKQRSQVRGRDRRFFIARLGEKYMLDMVLHHLWIENSGVYIKVILLHKSEHPNGGMDLLRDRKAWIEKEDWL